jgi:hypothetical protein
LYSIAGIADVSTLLEKVRTKKPAATGDVANHAV